MRSRNPVVSFALLAVVASLAGCKQPAAPAAPAAAAADPSAATPAADPAPAATPAPSIAGALADADYAIEVTASGKAPLKQGAYEEAIPDSSAKTTVKLGTQTAFGDLDGNGSEDAAAVLQANSGGSGDSTYVAAVLNEAGAAKPVASVFLGDRIVVKSLAIAGGKIPATWLDPKPGDPMSSAPSVETSKAFVLQGDQLIPAP
jgi:hypothetical protein